MEKWLVVAGIWMLFATCMVMFIRGATAMPRAKLVPIEIDDERRQTRRRDSFRA